MDDRAVQLLLQLALTKKKSEEEREERRRQEEVAEHERRMRVLDRRIAADEQLTPEESREGRGRGRRGGNANFQNPLPQFADVPVLFSDKFQQSKKFEFMVPQTQFIDDVWTHSLCNRDRYVVFWYRKLWLFRSCSSSLAVNIPFVPQMLIPMVQSAQQIKEIPQLLLIWWSMFLLPGRADSQVLPWRSPWRSHSCSSSRNL